MILALILAPHVVAQPPPKLPPIHLDTGTQVTGPTVVDVSVPPFSHRPMGQALSKGRLPAARQPGALTPLRAQASGSPDEYYRPESVRLGEQGASIVRVCVDPEGAMEGRPSLQSTAGSARLDVAAISWATHALRFQPAMRDGQPVVACKGFRVNFRLKQR